jgi:hypothetical protein
MQSQTTTPQYTPAYLLADFSQSIDRTRPRTLLTQDPIRSGTLQYRYTDTGETVTAPNIWYTQTVEANVARLRFQAEQKDEHARKLSEDPPYGESKQTLRREIARARAYAELLREAARKLEREQEAFFYQVSDYLSARSPA